MDPSAASANPTPYNPMVSPAAVPNMQMLNFNNILNVKDSRWLQLEVCREFQRNKCSRPDTECKFAHPPVNVEVQNGRVTACYDSIKGRCNREKPPCKYFHPPQHLKDQLLINGRNHLALKNAFMTQIQGLTPNTQLVHGTLPVDQPNRQYQNHSWIDRSHQYEYISQQQTTSPYLTSVPAMANFSPFISSPLMTVGMTDAVGSQLTGVVPQQVVSAQKVPRTDRLEAFPGMGVPYKRPAPDKSGVPVYQQTGNAAYHQALMQQLGGQSYVPVSCEYGGGPPTSEAAPPDSSSPSTSTTPTASASPSVPLYAKRPSAPLKTTTAATPIVAPPPPTSSATGFPGLLTHGAIPGATFPGFPAGYGMPTAGLQMNAGGMMGGLAGLGMAQSLPMMPQLFYPPSNHYILPQFTALSNNPQHAWAGGAGEQPYKKLKTS